MVKAYLFIIFILVSAVSRIMRKQPTLFKIIVHFPKIVTNAVDVRRKWANFTSNL